jgi:hypothetical protein
MSVVTANTVHIENFPMQIALVTFTNAGDSLNETLDQRGISKDNYICRHVLKSGWFAIDGYLDGEKVGTEFPESPFITKLRYGVIVTPLDTFDIDSWTITAVEDNSSFYCIHPVTQRELKNNSMNDLVRDKVWRIPSNAPFSFKIGRYYISNVDLTINGVVKKAYEPIACVFREVDVMPEVDAAIAEFWVEKVYISK